MLAKPFPFLGTGKTITGVHIAYWFSQINQRDTFRGSSRKETPKQETTLKAPPQVLYCGPSNKSVDVVAGVLAFLCWLFTAQY